jgi:DNA replication and repair protein RecF
VKLRKLLLRSFRNYESCELDLSLGVTLLSGRNAQGKTNLLEGIYSLSAGTSFRAGKDSEMVRWGDEAAWVKGHITGNYSDFTLSFSVSAAGRKMARLNDVEKIKPSELSDRLNAVAFIPDDLSLVKGAPSDRRRFLDLQISQLSHIYRDTLNIYARILLQKNALLKRYHEMEGAGRLLDVFNEELADAGSRIILMRSDAVKTMSPLSSETYGYIAASCEGLGVYYQPSVDIEEGCTEDDVKASFSMKLSALRPAEIARGASLVGPQRDDIGLFVDKRPAASFGSQGQQRTIVIALKLAEAEAITAIRGDAPIMLLDDVLSELDDGRRARLITRFLDKCQTVITATDAEYARSIPGCISYCIADGGVSQA